MDDEVCGACGLSHAALGVIVEGRQLRRKADSKKHLVRVGGGSWAFSARLWDAHPEIGRVIVHDTATNDRYFADRADFECYAFRQVLHPDWGEQIILPFVRWRLLRLPPADERRRRAA